MWEKEEGGIRKFMQRNNGWKFPNQGKEMNIQGHKCKSSILDESKDIYHKTHYSPIEKSQRQREDFEKLIVTNKGTQIRLFADFSAENWKEG